MARSSVYTLVLFLLVPAAAAQEVFRGLYSPDGIVFDAGIAGDTLYAGGSFGFVAAPTGQVAVLDKTTGEPDLSQARFGGETVWAVISDGAGGYYAGGDFTAVDGQPRFNLAHILADGTLDPGFAPNPRGTGSPDYFGQVDVLFLDGGVLYVGGRFDIVAGQPRRNLAALHAATGALLPLSVTMTSDNQGGGDARGDIIEIAVRDGVVYFSGLFSEVGGAPRRSAAAVRAATGEVLAWDLAINDDDGPRSAYVFALVPGDSTLYIGGDFNQIRGLTRVDGAEVTLADPVTGQGGLPTPWISELGIGSGSVVTPDFIWTVVYDPSYLIYRIDRRTGDAQPAAASGPYGLASAMAFDPTGGPSGQGTFYVAASKRDFDAPRGRYNAVVAVDAATLQLTGYEVLAGTGSLGNDYIRALAVAPGPAGRVFAAGEPPQYGGAPRRFLAGLDLTTGRVTGFGAEYVVQSSVEEVAISPDERFAYFVTFNGIGVGDLTTGELYAFPGGRALPDLRAAWAEGRAGSALGSGADSVSVRRPGPVVTRVGGTPAPAFRAPPPDDTAQRDAGGDRAVRGGTGSLVASSDRLYYHPEGGVVAYDRTTGATLWATPFREFIAAPDTPKLLLVEGGPPGAPGDTLFASGHIFEAAGQPRDLFVALGAATGAVLGWRVVTTPAQASAIGSGMAAVPGDGRIFLGGEGIDVAGGLARTDVFAASRRTGSVGPWNPNPAGVLLGVTAMAAQAGPDGRASVVYASYVAGVQGGPGVAGAFDARTGARLVWDMGIVGNGPSSLLLAERQGWVIASGSFEQAGGGGHANLVAVRPAVPFVVAGEAGGPDAPGTGALVLAGPNPFRSRTALALTLPEGGPVEASLFDVLGRRVAVLHDGVLGAGTHTLAVDASALPAGVYVARVAGPSFAESLTLTVVR